VILDPAHPAWVAGYSAPRQVGGVVVESSLSSGAGLADGTPVATVRLRDDAGRSVLWILRAGEGTGEWAARRPDVERTARLRSPPAWISWIAGDFFAQRYRAAWSLEVPARCTQVRVELARGLPLDVGLTLHQVEVRRAGTLALPAGDPFRGTLVILPLILAALWQIRRWCERLGGGTLGAGGTAGELVALALLLLLVWARPHLALARADEAIAAGLLLVLGHRLVRQTIALRPLLGERVPSRPSALFFSLPLIAYLAILPWSTGHRQPDGDEPFNLLITHSLAYDFDADLTNNYAAGDWKHFMERSLEPQPGDPRGPHGEVYSRHNELLPLLLAPAYRLAGKNGALAMMAVLTAALAWMTVRLARHYVPDRPGEVLAAWALVAFAPPLLLYSYQVWVEVPAALLLMGGLDRILTLDGQRSWRWKEWLGIGLSVLLLPLLKIRFLLIAGPLLALGWWYAGRPRRPVLILGAMLAALAGGMLLYNQLLYSNPLKIHTWQEVDPAHYGPLNYFAGLTGLLWDAAFGLFGCAPVWLLLLPAVLLQIARRQRLLAHLAVLTLPYLVIVAPRIEWYGGWSPPFRYALIGLPLLGLALAPLLAQRDRPGARALLAGLAALTLALTLVWVVVPGWTYNFADGRTYLLDTLGERLGLDLARFFPSSIRPRAATWIWPPLSLVVVSVLWWWPGRKRTGSESHPEGEGRAGRIWAGDRSARPDPSARPSLQDDSGNAGLLAGFAAVLILAAALPVLASRAPTSTVELEDPQVWKSGGHLYPDRWVIERARYRGSWVLRVGESLRTPIVPGGKRVRLTIQAQLIRNQPVPFSLDVLAGDRLLATWRPGRERTWVTIALGPFDWPVGAPLVLAAHGARPPGELNGVLLDRVDLVWP
jgi:hypothetical protein